MAGSASVRMGIWACWVTNLRGSILTIRKFVFPMRFAMRTNLPMEPLRSCPGHCVQMLYLTIPNVLQLLAGQGFSIIVDSFITTIEEFKSYKEALERYGVLFVYLDASEATIAQREAARGDRLKGSALHWLKRFDFQEHCDLCINTEEMNTQQIGDEVFRALETRITLP